MITNSRAVGYTICIRRLPFHLRVGIYGQWHGTSGSGSGLRPGLADGNGVEVLVWERAQLPRFGCLDEKELVRSWPLAWAFLLWGIQAEIITENPKKSIFQRGPDGFHDIPRLQEIPVYGSPRVLSAA